MTLVNTPESIAQGFRRLGESAGVPLYELVKRQLSEAILFGQFPPGTQLPGEVTLAQSFGVAVGTVRRALAELTAEGLLTRRRKTGTVVTGRSPHHSLRTFFQYFRLHGMDGSLLRSRAEMIDVARRRATAEECTRLNLAGGADVLHLRRVRRIDGVPVMTDHMTMAAARLPGFPERAEDVPELIYLHLLEHYGVRISAVREQLTARLADDADLALLDLDPPAAILVIDEIAFDQMGAPTILGRHHARTDRHCYVNEVR